MKKIINRQMCYDPVRPKLATLYLSTALSQKTKSKGQKANPTTVTLSEACLAGRQVELQLINCHPERSQPDRQTGRRTSTYRLINLLLFTFHFSLFTFNCSAQIDTSFKKCKISYIEYIDRVSKKNIEYAIEKFNVNIADAKIEAAKVFLDPSLSTSMGQTKEDNMATGFSVSLELSKTIELGGKRKSRIDVAKSESKLANAMLEDYFRNLRADATIDFLTTIKLNSLFDVNLNSWQTMKKISDADSIRLSLGSIMAIDATQSKIESGSLLNDLLQAESDRKSALIKLSLNTGAFHNDTILFPSGNLKTVKRNFALSDLISAALNNRADIQAASFNNELLQNILKNTRKEKRTHFDLNIGTSNSYVLPGKSLSSTDIYAGIAIPLKFSNLNKGTVKIAQYQVQQADLSYKQIENKIQNEILQSYFQYISSLKQVENYDNGLLEQAKYVLDGKIFSYTRGETPLLDVLNAQRTYNELQISYYETLFNCFVSLVELERSAGIWDINL